MSVSAQQTSVFVGSETRMPCRTTSQNPVEWTHWAIGAKMQRFVYANNLLSDGYNGPDGRHSIISKASFGIFDLVIANIRTSDAGTYKCFDDVGNFDNTNAIYEMTVIGEFQLFSIFSFNYFRCCVIVKNIIKIHDSFSYRFCHIHPYAIYISRVKLGLSVDRPKYSGMADVTAVVQMSLDRWRMGGPIYVIRMIDRWAWFAHGPQMS